jgi:putative GTP pyrophosphokinase
MPYMSDPHLLRLQQEYRDIQPIAELMAKMIVTEVRYLLDHGGISLAVPIEHRVKTWASIEEKFIRAGSDISKFRRFSGATLAELSDLIGIRIIVLFERDIEKVQKVINGTFDILDSENKNTLQSVDQFGYSSIHYQIRVPKSWKVVPTIDAYGRFEAEVQVRTLAQHMWAAASHKLQYKVEESVPDTIRRAIHRIASLLETVDSEYERLLSEREKYRSQIQANRGDSRLNSDVLESVLNERLPQQNKAGYEPYSMLVWELGNLGILRVSDLDDLITRRLEEALEDDRKIVDKHTDKQGEDTERSTHFFTHTGLLNMMLEKEFGMGFHSKIFKRVGDELERSEHQRPNSQ